VNRTGDAIEPGVESREHQGGRIAFGERGEPAQIGIEQRCLDGLADVASQRSSEHPRRAAAAEIGFESRRQCGARSEDRQWRRGEARDLSQLIGLTRCELTRPDPAQRGPVRSGPDNVVVHEAGGDSGEPAPTGVVRWACFRRCRGSSRGEPHSLDDFPIIGAPQPGAPGDERVRNGKRQRAADERQAILDQTRAEFRQQPVGARRLAGCIDEPGERRRKLHGAIMGLPHQPCH
jgi:hypothetical protein